MLHAVETSKSVEEVAAVLPEIVANNKFGILGVHDLRGKMREKGLDFDKECRVFEVCNPGQAKKVLESDMAISTALPCRISVYEEGGKTKIATLKPTALLALFGKPELVPVAAEVERVLFKIMEEAR
ncbi:MAG: DUF302 domain-containing protein [Elusimicrobiota bacterium]